MGKKTETGSAEVRVSRSKRGETSEERAGRISESVAPSTEGGPARIEFGAGATINMGNFESARIDVRLSVPCKLDPESIDSAYEFAREWVSSRIDDEAESLSAIPAEGEA